MLYPISEPIPDSVDDLFGYINSSGDVLIPVSYAGCSHFFEGKAAVVDRMGKSGFIDYQGNLAIPHRFEGLESSRADYARSMADTSATAEAG